MAFQNARLPFPCQTFTCQNPIALSENEIYFFPILIGACRYDGTAKRSMLIYSIIFRPIDIACQYVPLGIRNLA